MLRKVSKILHFDMDGVLVDFASGIPYPPDRITETGRWWDDPKEMQEKGFFRKLPLMPGAKEAIEHLMKDHHLDIHIASKPLTNGFCASEKFEWVAEHLPFLLKKTHLIQDKGLLHGDYLVDDDMRWKSVFKGHMFLFNSEKPLESWKTILDYMDRYRVGM